MACSRCSVKKASFVALALLLLLAAFSFRRAEIRWEEKQNGVSAPVGFDPFAPVAVNVQSRDGSIAGTDGVTEPDQLTARETSPLTAVVDNNQRGYKHETSSSCGVSGGGFALALSFHDQQTWACGNLLALQYWAKSLNMTVLEPFLTHTTLKIPREIGPSDLPLSTLYDLEYWNEYNRRNGNALAVTWECFLDHAPKKLILVCVNWFIHVCDNTTLQAAEAELLIVSHGFRVVRNVCLKTQTDHRMSITDFNQRILGNFSADEVTVVFQEWSQQTVGDVLDVRSAHVPMALANILPLKPSKWIEKDVEEYISRNLNRNFVAILLRTEWIKMYSDMTTVRNLLLTCFNRTLAYLKEAKSRVNSESVFLGMDIGKYGSATIKPDREKMTISAIEEHFLNSVFPGTISEWEHTFAAVSHSGVPGYVGLLQRSIAIRASCLLLVGSGSFLKQASHQYLSMHPHGSERCYLITDSSCDLVKSVGFNPTTLPL